MADKKLSLVKDGSWDEQKVESWLKENKIPIRLAAIDKHGFPVICSLWFMYEDNAFWCATHKNSRIARLLENNPNCGFEVAVNDIPYKGVRGQGTAELFAEKGGETLGKLIDRFLGNRNSPLAEWLLSRSDEELAIKINIQRLGSWDFSSRMSF